VIGWLIFAGYLLLAAVTSRALMRIIMTRTVCTICKEGWFTGRCFSPWRHQVFGGVDYASPQRVPMGEVMPRSILIGVVAVLAGLGWPFTGFVVLAMRAPRTSGELARDNADLVARIHDLERSIGPR